MQRNALIAMVALSACALFGQTTANQPDTVSWQDLNKAFGIRLWRDDNLFDDDARATAQRLKWPEESRTSTESSYRLYPLSGYQILGTRPYSVALYARNGTNSSVSIVFANKGDSAPLKTDDPQDTHQAQKALKQFARDGDAWIKADADMIEQQLDTLFGKSKKDKFGQSQKTRERVDRWDWQGHSLLLSSPKGEYARLQIVPTALATMEGAATRKLGDAELRKLLALRIERRPNGDMVLIDIPMVSQGPKGYCVPATWERYLRYVGIPADMYVLAMAGGTGIGGGTSVKEIAEGVAPLVQKHNRRIDKFEQPLSTAEVAKYIEKGLPLMWSIKHVSGAYEDALLERARQRKTTDAWDTWKERVKEYEHDADKLPLDTRYRHMCMIIGYNNDTKEIAISDSWGPQFRERWITQKEAKAISDDIFYVVHW